MAAYITRCGSDQNSETFQILPILDSLEQDLLVPYVEKRHKHENNPKTELQNALNEITQREQDLKAAIGISKFLIRSNKDLLQKLKLADDDKKELIVKIHELETEITAGKNEFISLQEKNYEITSSLDNTEDELERVSSDYHKLLREKSKNKMNMSLDSISLDRFSAEINDMTLKFREEYDLTLKAKIDAEMKCANLEEEVKKLNKTIARLENEMGKTNRGELLQRKSVRESPVSISIKSDIDDFEDNYQEVPKFSMESGIPNENISIRGSFLSPSNIFNFCAQDTISVLPVVKAQVFNEEFFKTTLYVVKKNSPHLEELNADYKPLYDVAVRDKIPLHKWHLWIESQLTNIYYKNLTKSNTGIKTRR
ncbi:hypothetical protein SteCoe_37956 [Stentor coeruleus]|uniref:Uncharacterized protein n=1 Tax=Stentor coeruleus TaxID=5963 RepID=A0A1R2AME4_9CILI|nr:hypothetical protein SteCoe_37956 [Stentor coeruleus]